MPEKLCHILFIEDNADTGQLVTMILESRGYSVTCVHTKSEALALMKTSAFDLYLLDNRLPDGNGVELCRYIRDLLRFHREFLFCALIRSRAPASKFTVLARLARFCLLPRISSALTSPV
jgi:CheY-like chemotaxis protein